MMIRRVRGLFMVFLRDGGTQVLRSRCSTNAFEFRSALRVGFNRGDAKAQSSAENAGHRISNIAHGL
jgi:hypothetical protein